MAVKTKSPAANSKQPPLSKPKSGLVMKSMAILVALLILIAIGFAVGVYLKLIDVEKLANDMNLSQYPVVGKFFPKTNFETVNIEDDTLTTQPAVPPKPNQAPSQSMPVAQIPQPSDPNIITKEDLEKQAKLKQQEEAKRISKLARLYGGMKPEEATAIMKELDDATVLAIFGKMDEEQVAKILALFDPNRAARLTQDMLRG